MIYYLFQWLENEFQFPGASVFQYISFRTGMAAICSLVISLLIGKKLIDVLMSFQVKESVRELGLDGEQQKKGTPTMGGLIILAAILIPSLLFAKLHNIYIVLILISTVWLGTIGFIDDYIKVFKHNKKGLAGKFKVIGQVGLGLIVATTLYFHPDVVVRDRAPDEKVIVKKETQKNQIKLLANNQNLKNDNRLAHKDNYKGVFTDVSVDEHFTDFSTAPYSNNFDLFSISPYNTDTNSDLDKRSTKTTIPFFKFNEFDYSNLISWMGDGYEAWTFLIYIPIVIFIITAVSNGANITDGLDGLATGTSAIIAGTIGILAYVSGHYFFSKYLNIMFIPNSGELVVFIGALIGACVGFLWYNSYPAQVFMGDTGSLTLGGVIAVLAIMVRKELLIPILCGVFLVENLSVILQVGYFKYTRKKLGVGRRIFKMAPLHHHYQLLGYNESKIVTRFWIVGLMLAVLTILTLKLR
ncbi:MAG: phospho-N-acetylmuramoyl-pentapeptide-transferase [Bacteroidia bacterium]|nr:phospho-N-acetylmuramoyl-pentapeptide-transferase [Bacteroidia bacterium]